MGGGGYEVDQNTLALLPWKPEVTFRLVVPLSYGLCEMPSPPDKSPVSQRFPVRGDEISVALFSYASLTNHTKSLVSGHHAFLNSERVPFFHMHLSMPSGLFYCQCTDYLTLSRFTVWPYCTVSTHESVNLRCADFQCRQYYYH